MWEGRAEAKIVITICCVFVRGYVRDFRECGPRYVQSLASMVKRYMDRPYRFICLTDYEGRLYGSNLKTIRIPSAPGIGKRMSPNYPCGDKVFPWWQKLHCFNAAHEFSGRMLYLDLDTLIVAPLAPIIDYPSTFALVPHAGDFNGRFRMRVVKKFNSSVMVWDAGVNDSLFSEWKPHVAIDLHGDQDWIGQQAPNADAMPLKWFPRISELGMDGPTPDAKVVLMKNPKNTIASEWYSWVREAWM